MASFFRRRPKQIIFINSQCTNSRFKTLQGLQLQWRMCSSSPESPASGSNPESNTTTTSTTATNANVNTETSTSNAELMTQLQTMQKQLNAVNKNTKKSRWKWFFGAIYFTPAFIVYYLLFSFWKNTKDEILEQKEAYKVININVSGIHSFSNASDLASILNDNTSSISFLKLKKCIDYACNDENVLGISLIMDNGAQIGFAQTQELREELKRFKHKNKEKFITSYAKSVDMKEYILSTIADEFYLMESAVLNIYGFSFPQLFFKKLLAKCGVKPFVLKREKYKTFAEMFERETMSDEHRESLTNLGGDLYSQFINVIANATKNKNIDDVKAIVDNAPYITTEAISKGLATDSMQWKDYQLRLSELGYEQINKMNETKQDEEAEEDGKKDEAEEPDILFLSPKEYLQSFDFAESRKQKGKLFKFFLGRDNPKKLNKIEANSEENDENTEHTESESEEKDEGNKEIALINIAGEIRGGESEGTSCGSDTIEELIRSASASEDVIAILLRIDSPGGDAIASESIWNTVYDAKVNGNKPIIVSMGDVCASGGYYIASAADRIYALPATITGSIGVVMMSLSVNELLTDKLEINYDQSIKFGDNSDIMSPFEYPREKLQERYETMIDSMYQIFMSRVSKGRDMSMEYVRNLAQGKVYTGQQALEIGLIDDLGGLAEAQLACEELAGLPRGTHAKIVKYATKMEKIMDILDGFSDTASASTKYGGYITPVLSQIASLMKLKLWFNSLQRKANDIHAMSNEPRPYYLCDL